MYVLCHSSFTVEVRIRFRLKRHMRGAESGSSRLLPGRNMRQSAEQFLV